MLLKNIVVLVVNLKISLKKENIMEHKKEDKKKKIKITLPSLAKENVK